MLRQAPFDRAQDRQDERRAFDIAEDFPFMLSLSKHSEPFFSSLLEGMEYWSNGYVG
jgi:hypothetical protein